MKLPHPLSLALIVSLAACSRDDKKKTGVATPAPETQAAARETQAAAPKPGRPSPGSLPIFIQPFQSCKDLPGPDGTLQKVCANNAISGAIQEGYRFSDVASCKVVRTQRPFFNSPAPQQSSADDLLLNDQDFMKELSWVSSQIRATGCACCHDSSSAEGTSKWDIAAPYVWTRQLSNRGVALLAGQLDATVLGAYEPKDNFGFDRSHTGAPTVDPTRMKAFFMKELQDRKVTDTEIKAMSPLGGGFVAGLRKKAGACDAGVGIDRQGLITWKGGAARYVYLLDATAETPIVPPNLDTPVGTLWRINVAADAQPISSGLAYGSVPAGASQKIPATGSAPQLLDGTSYRLHVLSDVGFVLANCYFTY